MLAEIKTSLEILNAIPSLSKFIPDNTKEKLAGEKRMTVLRAYLAEVQHNEEILKTVEQNCSKESTFGKIRTLASLLENSVGMLILYGSDNGEIKDIKNISEIDLQQEKTKAEEKSDTDDDEKFEEAKTLEQAIKFCVLRIDVLKTLSKVTVEEERYFKNINITARLNHIKEYSHQIRKALEMNLDNYSDEAIL